jgi:hypothetical protein
MTKKIGDKKVGGVSSTGETSAVDSTGAVSGVSEVKATGGVGAVKGAGSATRRQSTRAMTMEEREQLLKMINEEAEALFGKTGMSAEKRQIVENAVKMAVDSGLIEGEEE